MRPGPGRNSILIFLSRVRRANHFTVILISRGKLIKPGARSLLPRHELGWLEPKGNLTRGTLRVAAAVDQITTPVHAIVASDGTWRAIERLRRADHATNGRYDAARLPDGSDYRPGGEEAAGAAKEVALSMLVVVGFSQFLRGPQHLESDRFEPASLEALHESNRLGVKQCADVVVQRPQRT